MLFTFTKDEMLVSKKFVGNDRRAKGHFYCTTSHLPPLAGPIRRKRPSLRKVAIIRSTVLVVTPRASASCDTVCKGSDCRNTSIFSDMAVGDAGFFSDMVVGDAGFFSDFFLSNRGFLWMTALKRQPSWSSTKSIFGQLRKTRVMPEPRP